MLWKMAKKSRNQSVVGAESQKVRRMGRQTGGRMWTVGEGKLSSTFKVLLSGVIIK